jgi:hypothetical protein
MDLYKPRFIMDRSVLLKIGITTLLLPGSNFINICEVVLGYMEECVDGPI